MMNNSTVEKEAEKHFLGNLLEDDQFSFKEDRIENATSNLASQNIGQVVNTSTFWPEPPPPYTPSTQQWYSPQHSLNPLADLLQSSGLENRSQITNMYEPDSLFATPKQQQVHHHHHNLHHHLHTHNVVENHHHYHGMPASPQRRATEPEMLGNFSPFTYQIGSFSQVDITVPAVDETMTTKPGVKATGVIGQEKKKKQVVAAKLQPKPVPHSAPVKNMPFSYRDVAARQETTLSSGYSDTNQNLFPKKTTKVEFEKPPPQPAAVVVKTTTSSSERKGSLESVDQKKKKPSLEVHKLPPKKNVKMAKVSLENSTSLPALGKFGILTTIGTEGRAKIKKDVVPTVAQEIEPKKSFRAELKTHDPKDTDDESVERATTVQPQMKLEKVKKKTTQPQPQQQQKKKSKRKTEQSYSEVLAVQIWTIVLTVASVIQFCGQWTMQLIVDNCLKIHDVVEYWSEYLYKCLIEYIRNSLIAILSGFIGAFKWIRSCLFSDDDFLPVSDEMWGMKRTLAPVTSGQEFIDRMLRLKSVDAFRVLGVAANCDSFEITRNAAAIIAQFIFDQDVHDEVIGLVRSAMFAVEDPQARKEYTPGNAPMGKLHRDVVSCWKSLCSQVHERRNVMHCECGETHKKQLTDIEPREARQCDRCGEKHPAKENDIWVESRFFGLKMVVLTCTDNAVYDISEWASCQSTMLRNIRTNAHSVQYRLVTSVHQGSSAQMDTTFEGRAASGSAASSTSNGSDEQLFEMARLLFNYPDTMRRPKNRKHKRWNGAN